MQLIKTKYGLSQKDFNALKKKGNGKCFICRAVPKNRSLCVDHIHVKGFDKMSCKDKKKYVRGLLCFRCNRFLVGAIDRYKNPKEVLTGLFNYFSMYRAKFDLGAAIQLTKEIIAARILNSAFNNRR